MFFPGTIIKEKYRTDKLLGRGGMGEVWICHDIALERPVVLKIVSSQLTSSRPQDSSIFVDEARIGASLSGHPNVVTVFDIINEPIGDNHTLAIAMEYVEGMSCSDWIMQAPSLVNNTTQHYLSLMVALEVTKAISYAHRNSILHRDIKPLNIFISKYGTTRLGDFGIARYVDTVTREHTVWNFRSPAYSAPEQWEDKKPDSYTDIYQLGCTLYQLFTGSLPFTANSTAALINKHLTEKPNDPRQLNPLISENLSSIILACLEKNPQERAVLWQLADALAEDVQQKYRLEIRLDKSNAELIEKVFKVTDFDTEGFIKEGFRFWEYADFNEAISEAFELIMLKDVQVDLKIIRPSST